MCWCAKHLPFLPEARGRSLGRGCWARCCLVPGFLLTVKAEGIGGLTAKNKKHTKTVGCPGLWEYPAEPSFKRLPVSRAGWMLREAGSCAKPQPDARAGGQGAAVRGRRALQGAEHLPGWRCAGREHPEPGEPSTFLLDPLRCPFRPSGSSLQAGLGFRGHPQTGKRGRNVCTRE